jgi:DNA polymerase
MNLSELNKIIRSCKKCSLWKTRINAVPGEGPSTAKIMLLAQNPGRNENIQGKPFVGISGKFLDKLLNSINLKREEVFITGAVKCYTPKNRKPTKEEIEACKPYLLKQIELIKPKIIVLLGEVALESLLNEKEISKLHGRVIEKNGKIYFPTFHPAAAMRFPKIRKKMQEDFEKLKIYAKKLKNNL